MLWPHPRRLVSAACPPCWLWPRLHSLSATCPPSVRALCCLLWTRLQSLSAACPPCVHHLPALCPPCVVGFGRAPSPCPPLVRLVLLWPRLHSLSATCSLLVRRLSLACPPLVRLVSSVLLALAAPPGLVRHLSVLCPPLVRLVCWLWRRLSAVCPPCVLNLGPSSSPCRPLVRQASAYNVRLYSVWICVPLCPPLSGSICM